MRSRIIFPLLLILATVCGCLKFKQSHRSTGFHAANRDEKHCGICTWDGATVCVFLIPNSQGSFTRTATRPTYQGEFRWTDETTTAWSVQTPNGRNGTVRIKDREFDLADGCYFLVSKESGQMTVDQFDAELIQTNSADSKDAFEQLKDLAPSNPQIAKFLK